MQELQQPWPLQFRRCFQNHFEWFRTHAMASSADGRHSPRSPKPVYRECDDLCAVLLCLCTSNFLNLLMVHVC